MVSRSWRVTMCPTVLMDKTLLPMTPTTVNLITTNNKLNHNNLINTTNNSSNLINNLNLNNSTTTTSNPPRLLPTGTPSSTPTTQHTETLDTTRMQLATSQEVLLRDPVLPVFLTVLIVP